ncbi:MAG: oligopeptidase A, partial [Thiopseudomonas sp.]|nr:oligopeptidase A [Thiopseudomonas sp.]
MSQNPLLQDFDLPPFSTIKAEHVEPAIDQLLAESRTKIAALLAQSQAFNWDNLVLPMDEMAARLGQAWGPVSHLNAVCNSQVLREAHEACLPKLSEFWTELGQNKQLFNAYQSIANSAVSEQLNVAQRKVLEHELRDFRLSGIDLPTDKQQRYAEIQKQLSELSSRFSNNLLDATQAWTKHITDAAALAGVPESAMAQMAQA